MPLFSEFLRKNHCSHPHILKSKQLPCPYFVKKPSILSKTWCSHVIFLQSFSSKTATVMPIFGRKTSIMWKLHYFNDKEYQYDTLFFQIFQDKMPIVMPIFKKRSALKPIFYQKTSILSKNYTLMPCFLNFYEKLSAVKPLFGKKT